MHVARLFAFSALLLVVAQARATELQSITLERDVDFAATGGDAVTLRAGSYSVTGTDAVLWLTPDDGPAIALRALASTHGEEVDAPTAVAIAGDAVQPDALTILLLMPDGTSLEASNTGVVSRGLGDKIKGAVAESKRRRNERKQARKEKVAELVLSARENDVVMAFRDLALEGAQCLDLGMTAQKAKAARQNSGKFAGDLIDQVIQGMVSRFESVMAEELAALRSGRFPPLEAGEIPSRGLQKLQRLAADRPLAKCMIDFVQQKMPPKHDRIRAVHAQMDAMKQTLRAKIEPVLHEAIGKAFVRLVTGEDDDGILLTADELKAVANGVFSTHLIASMGTAQTAIADLATALGDTAAEPAALAALRQELEGMYEWPQDLRRVFGVEIVRAMGHKYIDTDEVGRGGYLVNQAVGLLQLSEGTVEKVASAICGLVPEAGAAICAIVEEAVDVGWNHGLVPLAEAGITSALHLAVDQAVDAARDAIEQRQPFSVVRSRAGPLVAVFDWMEGDGLQAAADEHLSEMRDALRGYNTGIFDLSERAAAL